MNKPDRPPETLSERTLKWLAKLPEDVQPKATAEQYPRLVNRIAGLWNHPEDFMDYINELLMDSRGDREGFPLSVAMELATVKDYYEMNVNPDSKAYLWDPRVKKTPPSR